MIFSRCLLNGVQVESIPMTTLEDGNRILLYQMASQDQQMEGSNLIFTEFRQDFSSIQIHNPKEVHEKFYHYFQNGNSLYLLVNTNNNVIGTIALDYDKMEPYISNLVICSNNRGKGYSKLLLQFIENSENAFGYIKLWCNPELKPFYEKMGYREEDSSIVNGRSCKILKKVLKRSTMIDSLQISSWNSDDNYEYF